MLGKITSLHEQCSTGKSGSFFYYTACGSFLIKTIHHKEFKFFKTILKDYYEYLKQHPYTLLMRIFGLHKFKYRNKKLYLIVITNVFNTNKEIHVRYDLKGSVTDRKTRKDPHTIM